MAFKFSERHIEEFTTRGATVFQAILPPSLIGDLRRATENARDIARAKHGQQTQRLQPVAGTGIDMKPFEDYRDLPELVDAIARVLSPQHKHGQLETIGVLLEPAELPYCTAWHRDGREILSVEVWESVARDLDHCNQINCALYEDSSTWIVPGSHARSDTPYEQTVEPRHPKKPDLSGLSYEEREYFCEQYAQSMPGAERLFLNAGDFALYRSTMWHLGSYLPYRKRATLHEPVFTPSSQAWWNEHIGKVFLPNAKLTAPAAV
jgi:hypothetical protein